MKKRKVKKKVWVFLIGFLVLVLGFVLVYFLVVNKNDGGTKAKVIDKIEGYGYTLESNKCKRYKELFKELANVLESDNVDEDKYARIISEMFAVDFYDLDSKSSKNDVGGYVFVYEKSRDNFVLKASDTVYKYVEVNFSNDRKQELPSVVNSSVKEVTRGKYSKNKIKDDNTYVVVVNLEYKKDLGYPDEVKVKLLHNGKKLEVYEME